MRARKRRFAARQWCVRRLGRYRGHRSMGGNTGCAAGALNAGGRLASPEASARICHDHIDAHLLGRIGSSS
jgi:hypothetical protein